MCSHLLICTSLPEEDSTNPGAHGLQPLPWDTCFGADPRRLKGVQEVLSRGLRLGLRQLLDGCLQGSA